MASSSQHALVSPTSPPPSAPSPPSDLVPSREELPAQVEELHAHLEAPHVDPEQLHAQLEVPHVDPEQLHAQLEVPHVDEPPSSECASCVGIRGAVVILQDLVFAVRQDVEDLRFWMEHLDQRAEKIESLLGTLLRSLHTPGHATDAPATSEPILAPATQTTATTETDTRP
jgi:hypothetical protein